MNTEVLNEVKNLLVDIANREGINLQKEFETPWKFKEFIIAITFTLCAAGAALAESNPNAGNRRNLSADRHQPGFGT